MLHRSPRRFGAFREQSRGNTPLAPIRVDGERPLPDPPSATGLCFTIKQLRILQPDCLQEHNQIPNKLAARSIPYSRGFLKWRLSDTGPEPRPTVVIGRCPKPFTKANLTGRAESQRALKASGCPHQTRCCEYQRRTLTAAGPLSHCRSKKAAAHRTCRPADHICSSSHSPRRSAWACGL